MKKIRKGQAMVMSTPGLDKVTTSISSMLHRERSEYMTQNLVRLYLNLIV